MAKKVDGTTLLRQARRDLMLALALLRELNDIVWGVIPSDLQPRVDAVLDRAEENNVPRP